MKVSTQPRDPNAKPSGEYPRFGRPVKAGRHPVQILDVDQITVTDQETGEERPGLKLTVGIFPKSPADAPEGPSKAETRVTAGHWTMDNLVEVFFPTSLGVADFDLPVTKLLDATAIADITTNPKKNGDGVFVNVKRFVGGAKFAGTADAF